MNDYEEFYSIEGAKEYAKERYRETGIIHFMTQVSEGLLHVTPDKPINAPQVIESGFTFTNGDELAAQAKAPNYIINNILETDSHGILGGSSMAFKTFVAIRIAHSVCTGKSFMGCEVFYSGKVLFACGEGQGALSRRIKAAALVYGDFNNKLLILNEPVRIDNQSDMARLKKAINDHKPALVIFDTFASLVSDTDENSPSDAGRALKSVKETCRNNHTCSLIIHHHGKDTSRGLRGASSFTNDVDYSLSLERQEGSMITTLTCRKMKDGDSFDVIYMAARVVDLGLERQDGKQATSLVIDQADASSVSKSKSKLGLNDDKALQALKKAIEMDGVPPSKNIIDYFDVTPENMPKKVVNNEKGRELAYDYFWVNTSDPKNLKKAKEAALRRAKNNLLSAYLIGVHGNYVWLIN
ncbi:hypothetical protein LBMAG43_21130 [Methylococcaceae bacterium]|nr:hypothetical protein LBMAG43_21130 [Methylococcaceae bacterium]